MPFASGTNSINTPAASLWEKESSTQQWVEAFTVPSACYAHLRKQVGDLCTWLKSQSSFSNTRSRSGYSISTAAQKFDYVSKTEG